MPSPASSGSTPTSTTPVDSIATATLSDRPIGTDHTTAPVASYFVTPLVPCTAMFVPATAMQCRSPPYGSKPLAQPALFASSETDQIIVPAASSLASCVAMTA